MENKKLITILILITTIILAGIALFTALKLYQLNQGAVLPSLSPAKSVEPSPQEPLQEVVIGAGICELTFTVSLPPSGTPSPSPSRSPSPSPSGSPSPSPSIPPQCWEGCDADGQCPGSLVCREISGANRCVNDSCREQSDCLCPPQASPSTAAQCWDECTYDNQCPGSLVCRDVSGVNRCVNDNCRTESDCVCSVGGIPASPEAALPAASTVPTQTLPEAGFVSPTVVFSAGGLLLLLLGLLL